MLKNIKKRYCISNIISTFAPSFNKDSMQKNEGVDLKSATDLKKLFIETYGCQMNVADSEVVASIMQMAGYEVCDSLDEADAVFLNTCSIRDNAEQKILNRLEYFYSLRKKKKSLIVGIWPCHEVHRMVVNEVFFHTLGHTSEDAYNEALFFLP